MIQYRLTTTGRHALQEGNRLVYLINEIAKDGVVTSEELVKYHFNEEEAKALLSLLSRSHFIEIAPIQGIKYTDKTRWN